MRPAGLFLFWRKASLLVLISVLGARGYGQAPAGAPEITFLGTCQRVITTDKAVRREQAEWLVDEARIQELEADNGWELEIRGKRETNDGSRKEVRTSRLGRDPRIEDYALTEDEQQFTIGIQKEFLASERKKRGDILSEKLKQLDRAESMVVEANDAVLAAGRAYLDVYYGQGILAKLADQAAYEEENLRILKLRFDEYEALQLDVLTTQVNLQTLRKRLADDQRKNERKLNVLRRIWGDPNLQPASLAAPDIPEATELENADPDQLIEDAWRRRPDLDASRTALSTLAAGGKHVEQAPELEMKIAGGVTDHERHFGDERRFDDTFDLIMEMNLVVPFSLRRENELRRKRHELDIKSQNLEIEARKESIASNIRQALEDYKVTADAVRIQLLLIQKLQEAERIMRLTAATMPETIKGNPEFEVRKAGNEVLEAQGDLSRAQQLKMEMLLNLLLELGKLSPTLPKTSMGLQATRP